MLNFSRSTMGRRCDRFPRIVGAGIAPPAGIVRRALGRLTFHAIGGLIGRSKLSGADMSATLAKQTEDRQKKDLVTWFAVRDCDGWVTAVQATSLVAAAVRERLGIDWPWSYRPVAFALRRLVRAGLVEERVELRKTPHKYRDTVREYRPRIDGYSPGELWPPVFPVPDNAPRRVVMME